jgi:hypothetical protein
MTQNFVSKTRWGQIAHTHDTRYYGNMARAHRCLHS